jgi:hypothetical protein
LKHKLGKRPAAYDHRDLQFASYRRRKISLPPHPAEFGHESLVTDWGVLGNSTYGDCVFAAAGHEHMLWCAEGNKPTSFDVDGVLADYSAVTGFDKNDPSTDQGTLVREALNYRRKVGVLDAYGVRHRLGGYVALELGNWEHLLEAIYVFGAVEIGFEFPSSGWDQFDAGQPWSVVPGASNDGGHDVPLVALRGDLLTCVTWGKLQQMTRAFYERYADESYALASLEILTDGESPEGFNLATLQDDLRALK